MEKEFKEIITESKKSLKKIDKNMEKLSENFTEEVNEFWLDLKKHLSGVEEKLDDAYDDFEDEVKLKGHLGMMEARERIKKVEEIAYEFTSKVSKNAQEELDIVTLRAHLLKMESEDMWEEKQKELSLMYEESKEEAEKLGMKAAKELNHIFLKLTEIV
ncbi:MAG: hypothetical protein WBM70_02295 [Sulfurovum sp.]|jgi:hypothetical protein|uniref:hypothetical protein n=1 Tax=Sulfurovum sp. TaxID=1969726 RepID=UPI003C75A266